MVDPRFVILAMWALEITIAIRVGISDSLDSYSTAFCQKAVQKLSNSCLIAVQGLSEKHCHAIQITHSLITTHTLMFMIMNIWCVRMRHLLLMTSLQPTKALCITGFFGRLPATHHHI